jgi:hypothetical protein
MVFNLSSRQDGLAHIFNKTQETLQAMPQACIEARVPRNTPPGLKPAIVLHRFRHD